MIKPMNVPTLLLVLHLVVFSGHIVQDQDGLYGYEKAHLLSVQTCTVVAAFCVEVVGGSNPVRANWVERHDKIAAEWHDLVQAIGEVIRSLLGRDYYLR